MLRYSLSRSLSLILVALFIGLIIWANHNFSQKTPPTSPSILESGNKYENTYFGYSIMYPKDWSIYANSPHCADGPDGLSGCLPKPDTNTGITIYKDYEQDTYTYPVGVMNIDMRISIDYAGAYYLEGSAKKITISGRDATMYELEGQTVITIEKDFPDQLNPNNVKMGITITFFYDIHGGEIYNDQLAIVSSLVVK